MTMLKLYHKTRLIGTISNITPEDTFEMSGDIALTTAAAEYKPLFSYLTNEEALTSGAEPPFDKAYLDDWFLENEQGVRKEIGCPGIYYAEGEILWRE
jgi:hypothetical protein